MEDNHNRGIDLIIRNGRNDSTYNIGGNNEWTISILSNLSASCLMASLRIQKQWLPDFPNPPRILEKAESLITYIETGFGHDRRYAINAVKISTELGYVPVESFETGIHKTLDWYLANEEWWRLDMDGRYQE